jgi:hypothetical protein
MKTTIILVLTAITVAAFAFHRQGRLTELKEETRRLEQHTPVSSTTRSGDKKVEAIPDAPAAQVELVCETMVEAFIAFQDRSRGRDSEMAERMKRLLLAAKDLSARDMAKVMDTLFTDSRLTGMERDEIIRACYEVLGGTAPFAWREYLGSHRDLPDWQNLFEAATRQCMAADSKRTLAMIEQEKARGNPEVATTKIRQGVLLALAASDPDKMLARAVSPELAADPDALALLGGFVDDQLKKPADHQRFLAALRRAQEKNPSPVLDTIRKDYVREMSNLLAAWPFEEMKTLVDGEFTRNEKLLVAELSSHRADLDDRRKWADWFLGIDAAEWNSWIATRPQRFKHPVIHMLSDWAREDAAASSTWLEKIPPGSLRDEATLEYAWMIADRDPDRAAGYLDQLPTTKGKQNLVKKIDKTRQKSGAQER